MRAHTLGVFLLLAALAASIPAGQAKGPLFYEDVLVEGVAQDFAHGALDITTVYVSELYAYDVDQDVGQDRVVVRIEPRELSAMSNCQVPTGLGYTGVCQARYDVYFRAAGQDHHVFAQLGNPGDARCCPVTAGNTAASADGSSVRLGLDRPALRLLPGTPIERLYVTSALVIGDQVQPADREPGDNGGVPHDRANLDGVYAPPYTLEGTYEFFTMRTLEGEHRYSVGGQAVEFTFEIVPTAGVQEDNIRFLFDVPPGWAVAPDRGTTGPDARGLLTGLRGGMVAHLGLQVSATDAVAIGDVATVTVHAYSSSQGYKAVPLTVRVSGTTIEDPDYVFQWIDIKTLKAGTASTLRLKVVDMEGAARQGLPLEVAFSHEGRHVTTLPATGQGDNYAVTYHFPQPGMWMLDARVANLEPAPHSAVTVQVSPAEAPAPAFIYLLGSALAVFVVKRRLPSRP